MIRTATLADLEGILAIERASFPPEEAFSRAQFRYLLVKAQGVVLVDEEGGEVRGFLVLEWPGRSSIARVYDIAVQARYRGQGIAQALLECAAGLAQARGRRWLSLEVREDNAPARSLYETTGFVLTQRLPDYYGPGRHGLRYRKALIPGGNPPLPRTSPPCQ
ncbi:MAG: GNAT family N-acetyltransferase [Chloroflexi bacterium]|nr:GNAT family N-acetyltransferase [Chloroflexota bacterium]